MKSKLSEVFEKNKKKSTSKPSKENRESTDRYLNSIKKFEGDRIELAKESAKKAWKVATAFGALAFLAVIALVAITPLKTVVPYMTVVDNITGQTHTIKPVSESESVTYGEAMDKYWLSIYVRARKNYSWEDIQIGYDTTKIMSSDNVFSSYNKFITSDISPVETFSENKNIVTKIKGVTFQPRSNEKETVSIVYYTLKVVNKDGSDAIGFKESEWRATIIFDYTQKIKTEEEQFLNPMGFKVVSYREDRIVN